MDAPVNETDVIAESNADTMDLDKRMERMERDLAEIKVALLGNVIEGTTGLLGRVRDREQQAENHDIRITRLEARYDRLAEQKHFDELEDRTVAIEKQLDRWDTRIRTAWWVVTIGGGSGVVALISRLLELFG